MSKPKKIVIHGNKATEEICTVFAKWRNKILQIQVCINNQHNNKMHNFVPMYNHRNSNIFGSAAIGFQFMMIFNIFLKS